MASAPWRGELGRRGVAHNFTEHRRRRSDGWAPIVLEPAVRALCRAYRECDERRDSFQGLVRKIGLRASALGVDLEVSRFQELQYFCAMGNPVKLDSQTDV